MALFVPDVQCLLKVFDTGNVGIAASMLGPNIKLDPNLPGFPNFEKTIFKGFQKSFEPQLTIVKAIGGLIEAATEFPKIVLKYSTQPPKIAAYLAEKLIAPALEAPKVILPFIPPSVDSIGNLILSPILENMVMPKIPSFSLPFAGLNIPIPELGGVGAAKGLPSIPILPGPFGLPLPPNLSTVLGILMIPINLLLDFFKTALGFFKAIVKPPKMPQAIVDILKLPQKLIPSLELFEVSIGLPSFPTPMIDFIKKTFEALINLIKVMFGLPGGKCPIS